MREASLTPLRDDAELEAALQLPVTVVYKHSPACPFSDWTYRQVLEFASAHPGVSVHIVDVVHDRRLSDLVARRMEVSHESPQAFVLAAGAVTWSGSHAEVSASNLAEAVSRVER